MCKTIRVCHYLFNQLLISIKQAYAIYTRKRRVGIVGAHVCISRINYPILSPNSLETWFPQLGLHLDLLSFDPQGKQPIFICTQCLHFFFPQQTNPYFQLCSPLPPLRVNLIHPQTSQNQAPTLHRPDEQPLAPTTSGSTPDECWPSSLPITTFLTPHHHYTSINPSSTTTLKIRKNPYCTPAYT